MSAPIGAVVGIYWDGAAALTPGDHLRTPTGRQYQVISVRIQKDGKHRGRQHLRCLVVDGSLHIGRTYRLRWYARSRRPTS